jgi:hypothetical protein
VDWVGSVETAAVVGALLISGYQTRRLVTDSRQRDRERRVELALNLYRDLVVDGDTANAFHRLSVALRKQGSATHRIMTWYLPVNQDINPGGLMDPNADGATVLFADLYRVMWYFERANTALNNDLIDREVFFEAAGFHVWWWDQILRNIDAPKAMSALRDLAGKVSFWAVERELLNEWRSKCLTDFDGGPPDD